MAIETLPPVGRDEDLGELLRRLRPRLDAILWRYRIPPADAEDRIQDIMLQFIRKRPQIYNPEAWIKGALKRGCLMHLRSRRRDRTVPVDTGLLELLGGSSVPDEERADLRRRLRKWIRKLSPKCRRLLHDRYVKELRSGEVAERTGYKPSSVDKVTRRCVDALSRQIAKAARAKAGTGARSETESTSAARTKTKPRSRSAPEPGKKPRPKVRPKTGRKSKPRSGAEPKAEPEHKRGAP